ncbi:hypothetical protein ACCD10_28970 [Pseudomonas sp. Pseusp122]|jgi:hypothetical protein|uniref:hypothetical protein n=1 Tax=unclassified Pseudomonas TaxID=196821 RepID=UPI0039A52A87
MPQTLSLHVSFPNFGRNYYSQHVVYNRKPALVVDDRFDDFLMSSASLHFNNAVIGLNDQFRFLNDILAHHLLEQEAEHRPHHARQVSQGLQA